MGDHVDEEVFMKTWIPSHLDQISDRGFIEKELDKRARGEKTLYERLLADPDAADTRIDEEDDDEEDHDENDADTSGAAKKKEKDDKEADDASGSASDND